MRRWRALVIVALLTVGRDASAQDRAGLMGGFSIGAGSVLLAGSTDDAAVGFIRQPERDSIGPGFNLYIGSVTAPRWAVLLEMAYLTVGASTRTDGDLRVGSNRVTFQSASGGQTAVVMAGAIQYWVTGRTWVRAGPGVASLTREVTIESADLMVTLDRNTFAPAVLAALGVDLWRRGNRAIDVQVHAPGFWLRGLLVTSPSVQVGFTWF
jgi:hypothetical protein